MTDHILVSQAQTRAELLPLIKLAVPLMVGLAAALLIGVVDTAMISPLGTVPLAAAGVTTAVLIILISALWGVVTALSVQISQAEGAQDPKKVALALRGGLLLCLLGGGLAALLMMALYPLLGLLGQPTEVLEILLPYWMSMAVWIIPFTLFFGLKALFDAVGRPWTAVGLSYLGVLINVPANYTLIHILDLGILGAGLASILSQCVSLIAALVVLKRAPGLAAFRQRVQVVWADAWAQAKDALPLCLGYAGEGGAYAVVGLMMGWLGAEALAAHQIVNALAGLAYMIPLGMAGAASIRVGLAVGACDTSRLRPILKASFVMVTLWQAIAAIVFITAGRMMAESMSDDPAVVDLAVTLFFIVALLQVADGVQGTALGALRGMSDMNLPTVITLTAYWPLALPASYALGFVFDYGAMGVWIGYTIGLVVAAVALPIRFWSLTKA
ncbi:MULTISPECIES: MATE family efflux transporter [unclassified Ruegeria]|uniref:MATE family efflux transporter n=1 Tax=unclassified Ruegeria TaxID=2625375 RepID=UPI001489975E|nr:MULTISPECIES: MATE family efflux transporter [unclassified Ruegeria]NOD77798.1 MATE family efflux transporter [Ruegeria sp. HKCCD4332]NOD88029.1 MATE family efflux transporter [Ruegeria sp. HKCCD4318]NOE14877.1 MATE family efflux transporter [Ruegeria sp. HKCCD4318-2]NOG11520.1 MATE family efflux transporter [Ruegeria sp. HKCCD4315]